MFAHTRRMHPVTRRAPARETRPILGLVVIGASVAAAVALAVVFESRRAEPHREVEPSYAIGGLGARVEPTEDDRSLDRAIEARDPALFAPRLAPTSCAEDTSDTTRRAARLTSFRFVPQSEGELVSALDPQLTHLHATVVTRAREGIGPLAPRMDGPRFGTAEPPHRLVLVVDAFDDPSDDARGALRGHLVLWSRARHAPVCAARVDITGIDEPAPSAAHPLAYARARLVMRAIHEGLGRLASLAR